MGHPPPHLACLAQHSRVEIKEKASMIEAITAIVGQDIEMANRYKVLSDGGKSELFFAVEKTGFCTRQAKQCCPDCAPWDLDILYTEGGANTVAYSLRRDPTCTCLCFNRPSIEVQDVIVGKRIGSVTDPFACLALDFTLRGEDLSPALKVNFPIVDAQSGSDVGHVQKRVPGCCKFLLASDVDNYKVDFSGVENPDLKALILAFSIFLDFRYFSDSGNDDDGGLMARIIPKE
mmetsp:Transcript_2080/g.6151  ORF Transcript_2080/g.6151 Transcript_2080/m.6151 type:complete len:233 (+) Transcript_2080:147-845(+)